MHRWDGQQQEMAGFTETAQASHWINGGPVVLRRGGGAEAWAAAGAVPSVVGRLGMQAEGGGCRQKGGWLQADGRAAGGLQAVGVRLHLPNSRSAPAPLCFPDSPGCGRRARRRSPRCSAVPRSAEALPLARGAVGRQRRGREASHGPRGPSPSVKTNNMNYKYVCIYIYIYIHTYL